MPAGACSSAYALALLKRCYGRWPRSAQAAADYFGVRIGIISSFADNFLIEVEPRERKSSRGEPGALAWLKA